MTAKECCEKAGIELQGDEGHPFHCGERMETRGGLIGTDYAKCRQCGLTIGNIESPHICGAILETYSDDGNWQVLSE